MITVRRAGDRFHTDHGWLDSWHTFSFADHYHPEQMGFRALRVINDDTVQPGQGFGAHTHRDMEIISYVLDGALAHRDNLGTGSVIRPGDLQRMSAGSGVVHSEFNASKTEPVHFLQIWIVPERSGLEPDYQQKTFAPEPGKLRLLVALYGAVLAPDQRVSFELKPSRHAWVHVARGSLQLNGTRLDAGDGAAVSDERALTLVGRDEAEVLLFDLA